MIIEQASVSLTFAGYSLSNTAPQTRLLPANNIYFVQPTSYNCLCAIDYIRAFYETGKSSLPGKLAPWLPKSLAREMPLVDLVSATPDIVTHPFSLDRPHVLMNKFSGPDDPQYKRVADTVGDLLRKIFDERHITKGNTSMRNERYSLKNLEI